MQLGEENPAQISDVKALHRFGGRVRSSRWILPRRCWLAPRTDVQAVPSILASNREVCVHLAFASFPANCLPWPLPGFNSIQPLRRRGSSTIPDRLASRSEHSSHLRHPDSRLVRVANANMDRLNNSMSGCGLKQDAANLFYQQSTRLRSGTLTAEARSSHTRS